MITVIKLCDCSLCSYSFENEGSKITRTITNDEVLLQKVDSTESV